MWVRFLTGFLLVALLSSCKRESPVRTLSLSLPYSLDSLEPGALDRLTDFAVLSNFYEPLVTTDSNLVIKPCLAERWENPDMQTWVFHLRPGVKFHNGRPLTAADVAFSIQRLFDDESLEARRHLFSIREVKAEGGLKVVIRTKTHLADFLNRIRFIHISPAGSSRQELRSQVNGTGPYRAKSYQPGEELTIVRNPTYWGPPPAIEQATLRLNRSPDKALEELTSGRSGFIQSNSVRALDAARLRKDLTVSEIQSIAVKLLYFDVASERNPLVKGGKNPFFVRRVREALNIGIDRAALTRRLPVPASPAFQLVPPFIFGHNASLKPPATDKARARALLAEAGFPNGFEVTFHARRLLADGAAAIQEELATLGIKTTLVLQSEEDFFETTRARPSFVMALTRYGCPTGDAANIFDSVLHTPDHTKGLGIVNSGGYANPEMDGLVEEAARQLQPSARRAVLERIMQIAMQELPWIPLYVDRDVYVYESDLDWRPRLDNYVIVSEIGLR
ncbi:MAG: hypothetical protein IT186_24050 [Acidobacteria bacterium]|nr:hypothetical protein [Acidobacteriota bacterium]